MWFKQEVLYPRLTRSLLWMVFLQEVYLVVFLFLVKFSFWNPLSSVLDWVLHVFHWKIMLYQVFLCLSTVVFGLLNMHFYAVEKFVCSTRFEIICKSLSPHYLKHILITTILGGVIAYCCTGLFYNNDEESRTYAEYFLTLEDGSYCFFVVGYGCYTGIMFSLKYFICNSFLVKFTLEQDVKMNNVRRQIWDVSKDAFTYVLKGTHWYYILFLILGFMFNNSASSLTGAFRSNEGWIYGLVSLKLLSVVIISGAVIFFNFSLYLCIFNTFVSQPYTFPIEVPLKGNKEKVLSKALCSELQLLKYLAVLDLRTLAQHNLPRRQQIFSISQPGGHPHNWKSITDICIKSLQAFIQQLQEYSMMTCNPKAISEKETLKLKQIPTKFEKKSPDLSEKIFMFIRERPIISYFFDEFPNAKLMKLFASSQPSIWMIEALGFLVSASYNEDKFGVIQSSLEQIICLLLDIKMAEEKMPVGLVGINTYVKDPQGRYEHIHQRLSLRTSTNTALYRIAATFKNDINGIYLPQEYRKYFERYLKQSSS
ncbi:nucleoporin NDC1-like [Uloborus diversus]|uniref:nucleoporin NDC1-like n=1 Tax=Uloborus diversus TaxID=327109 RepID=UPI00240A03BC|nr:nucleoporin NDC1-like [Uloborus diversus]